MYNVCLIFGGKSVEHEVSIITYFQVLSAIDLKKYKVFPVYLTKDNKFIYNKKQIRDFNTFKEEKFKKFREVNFIKKDGFVYLLKEKIDCVINLTHGKNLEDGTITGYFNLLGVSISSPKVISSAMFHSKYLTKLVLNNHKIKTIEYVYITERMFILNKNEVIEKVKKLGNVIIKPVTLGSSIGVFKATTEEEINTFIKKAFLYDKELIIERCLEKFNEFNQAFYQYKNEIIISKIEEVKNDSNFYSFESKYENGSITRVIPAKINTSLRNKITKTTKKTAYILNSNGVVRVDYLQDTKTNILYVNEVNVVPGALSYYLFEAKDIYFQTLIEDLITEAILEFNNNNKLISSFKSNILNGKSNKK